VKCEKNKVLLKIYCRRYLCSSQLRNVSLTLRLITHYERGEDSGASIQPRTNTAKLQSQLLGNQILSGRSFSFTCQAIGLQVPFKMLRVYVDFVLKARHENGL
jgi:hypothetical protein